MTLPGGFHSTDLGSSQQWGFAVLNGDAELGLWELSNAQKQRSETISGLIDTTCTFSKPAYKASDLSDGDRMFLLSKIAGQLGPKQLWFTQNCEACDTPFDSSVELKNIPIKPAAKDFPFVSIEYDKDVLKFRVPTGRDIESLGQKIDIDQARRDLIKRCHVSGDLPELTDRLVDTIDEALEDCAPEIATEPLTQCPDCSSPARLKIDLADIVMQALSNPLKDIHDIASTYHWSEADILSMPKSRREHYLALIEQDEGMIS